MRVLHYTLGLPPFRVGGLTRYVFDLMQGQRRLDHEVALLYPGHYGMRRRTSIRGRGMQHGIDVHEVVNPLPVPLMQGVGGPDEFRAAATEGVHARFLDEQRPDLLHIHSLMGLHRELVDAARSLGIPSVYTTHDYYGLCSKVTLFDYEGRACEDYEEGRRCVRCNRGSYSPALIRLMQSRLYEKLKYAGPVQWLRRKKKAALARKACSPVETKGNASDAAKGERYAALRDYHLAVLRAIDYVHFNSTVAQAEYQKYVRRPGEVVSITHAGIRRHPRTRHGAGDPDRVHIAYIGPTSLSKGVGILLDSLERLLEDGIGCWRLHLYGDIVKPEMPFGSEHYRFHGRFADEDLTGLLASTDLVVFPSLMSETFGLVGLEALTHGVPVLMATNVGFGDLVRPGETALVFEPTVPSLTEALKDILGDPGILRRIEANLQDWDQDLSMESHVRAMLRLYASVMKQTR